MGMARCWQVFVAMEEVAKDWTSRLGMLLWIAANQGWLEKTCFRELSAKVVALPSHGPIDGASAPTAQSGAEELRALRAACRNTLELVLAMLADPQNLRKLHILVEIGRPCKAWYHDQAKVLREVDAASDWAVRMSSGEIMEHLRLTLKQLYNGNVLETVGVRSSVGALGLGVDSEALARDEEDTCELMAVYAASIVRRRLCRTMWMWKSWPSLFACLATSADGAVAARTFEELRDDYEGFVEAQNVGLMATDEWVGMEMRLTRPPYRKPSPQLLD